MSITPSSLGDPLVLKTDDVLAANQGFPHALRIWNRFVREEHPTVLGWNGHTAVTIDAKIVAQKVQEAEDCAREIASHHDQSGPATAAVASSPGDQRDQAPGPALLLDARHQGFARDLLAQSAWTQDELHDLAHRHVLMPDAAILKVKQWAEANLGHSCLERDAEGNVRLQQNLTERIQRLI
jgi:TerB-C domain